MKYKAYGIYPSGVGRNLELELQHDPADPALGTERAVMSDVHEALRHDGISFGDIARILIPLAFKLLCKAAFR